MIVFKSIKPAVKFKSSTFREQMRAQALKIEPKIKADFQKTTRTWKDKPEFTSEVAVGNAAGGTLAKKATGSASGVRVEVSTDSDVYRYVDEGTRIRYATMTQGFIPKTRVRKIASYKGRGGLLFVNRNRPRPGIKARRFSLVIREKWKKPFRDEMEKAINDAARKSGHGVK